MKLRAACILFMLAVGVPSPTAVIRADSEDLLPTAEQLLRSVEAQLPREPLALSGELIARRRHGVVVRQLAVNVMVDWGSSPAVARYQIHDAEQNRTQVLTVKRMPGEEAEFTFAKGSPPKTAPLPALFDPIPGTDISWGDLSLDFLWWQGGKILGMDEAKGRSCYVVSVPAPSGPYGTVKLWIDEKLHMLLQAEAYDHDGVRVRRLWIRSLKKIDGRWMIKDMEFESYPLYHRTKLHIEDVVAGTRKGEQTGE